MFLKQFNQLGAFFKQGKNILILFIGVGICLLQQATGLITLDEASYYITVAPIKMIWWQVAAVCAGTSVVCFISLFLPTLLIPKVSPVKAIEFK